MFQNINTLGWSEGRNDFKKKITDTILLTRYRDKNSGLKVGPHTHHKNHFGDRIFWHGRKVIFSFFLGVEAPLHDVTKGYAMDEMDWAVLTEKVHFIDIQ